MRLPIILWGKIYQGTGRGQQLGFPTANFRLHQKVPDGVYIAMAKIDTNWLPALTFVGAAQTFNEKKRRVEVYFLNAQMDCANTWLSTKLIKRLRDSRKFNSVAALIKAMRADKKAALEFFTSYDFDKYRTYAFRHVPSHSASGDLTRCFRREKSAGRNKYA